MNPQRFAESNTVMLAPHGMEECNNIHAWKGAWGQQPAVITAWRPTPEELVQINLGEPIYLGCCGTTMPPVFLIVGSPFEK